mmetsp:Transcript_146532/g.207804  ORF Transcript_146532/g.207804 Transcript_146532/m.207804 type:complete len:138 (-) Transcript_146532:64-477(-)
MAANSLRGGKGVYGPHCLQSNWFEARLEPAKQGEVALDKVHQLPAASAKTWTKTSETYGGPFKEDMDKKPSGVESASWLSYMKIDKLDMYTSTHVRSFGHPASAPASGALKLPMTENQLEKYRTTWTRGDADRFTRG